MNWVVVSQLRGIGHCGAHVTRVGFEAWRADRSEAKAKTEKWSTGEIGRCSGETVCNRGGTKQRHQFTLRTFSSTFRQTIRLPIFYTTLQCTNVLCHRALYLVSNSNPNPGISRDGIPVITLRTIKMYLTDLRIPSTYHHLLRLPRLTLVSLTKWSSLQN